jgi:hypothetical protein
MPTSCPGVAIAVGSTNDLKPESLIWVRRKGIFDEAASEALRLLRQPMQARKKVGGL